MKTQKNSDKKKEMLYNKSCSLKTLEEKRWLVVDDMLFLHYLKSQPFLDTSYFLSKRTILHVLDVVH